MKTRATYRVGSACGFSAVYASEPGETLIPGTMTDVETFARALPHGSGLDTDWHLVIRKRRSGRPAGVTAYIEWHAMNENGFYVGYLPVRVVFDVVAGEITLRAVRTDNRAVYDNAGYLGDMMADVCRGLRRPAAGSVAS